ncbi:MAG: non-homologous end-joining DNA ligase [Kineosporiaceae bacterium]
MLATPASPPGRLPEDATTWAYEVKWDGMRALVDVAGGALRVTTRTGRQVAELFPELRAALGAVAEQDVLLDGELVVMRDGVPSFAAMADRFTSADPRRAAALAVRAPVRFVVFDVLRLGGRDLTAVAWRQRREELDELSGRAERGWYASPVFDDGEALLAATLEQGLEGAMAKRRASRYVPGARSLDWVKVPHRRSATCVVGGWRPETGGSRPGALLLGTPDVDAEGRPLLRFCGRVGSGLAGQASDDLLPVLRGLAAGASPFGTPVPRPDAVGAHWVRPELSVEVRFKGRTDGGRLREPVFLGVRHDAG